MTTLSLKSVTFWGTLPQINGQHTRVIDTWTDGVDFIQATAAGVRISTVHRTYMFPWHRIDFVIEED